MSESPSEWQAAYEAGSGGAGEKFRLVLYIAGISALSRRAIVNTRALCDTHLAGRYELEIIDLANEPQLAMEHQIIAAPTLLKSAPLPSRRFVGDMSRTSVILERLGVSDATDHPSA